MQLLQHVVAPCFPQVEATASSLNTNDVFVLKSPKALFVWRGVGATDEEMVASKHVVGFLGGSPTQVSEGKESGECPGSALKTFPATTARNIKVMQEDWTEVRTETPDPYLHF